MPIIHFEMPLPYQGVGLAGKAENTRRSLQGREAEGMSAEYRGVELSLCSVFLTGEILYATRG